MYLHDCGNRTSGRILLIDITPLDMGILVEYLLEIQDGSDAQAVLVSAKVTLALSLDCTAYTWVVLGLSCGIGNRCILSVYCGGESTEQWSSSDQLRAWPLELEGLPRKPNLYSFAGSRAEAYSDIKKNGSDWITRINLVKPPL